MRAPVNKRRSDKRIDGEAAIEEASRQLRPLFVDFTIWSESGTNTRDPKKAFKGAIGIVENALDTAEFALDEAVKCDLNEKAKDAIALAISFIGVANKAAIPELRRARPPIGPHHGRPSILNAPRNQAIAGTVASIREQFEVSQEEASWVVSEALKSLVAEHRRAFGHFKERGADPVWIEECLKFVSKLKLTENTIEDIAKKYRT